MFLQVTKVTIDTGVLKESSWKGKLQPIGREASWGGEGVGGGGGGKEKKKNKIE